MIGKAIEKGHINNANIEDGGTLHNAATYHLRRKSNQIQTSDVIIFHICELSMCFINASMQLNSCKRILTAPKTSGSNLGKEIYSEALWKRLPGRLRKSRMTQMYLEFQGGPHSTMPSACLPSSPRRLSNSCLNTVMFLCLPSWSGIENPAVYFGDKIDGAKKLEV